MTNADKIRAMTDAELANFIAVYMECEVCPASVGSSCGDSNSCRRLLLCWLKQEEE